ncbi:MAG: class I SAM-dependent methyltransferase [Candidatus Desulfofervidus auxilii]|nr:class I SAM-dependent methyltransferase [Candidatus Desulfofervidus auxilii]
MLKKLVKYCDVQNLSKKFSSKFSVIILSHVLEHLNNPLKAIEEAHKISKFVIIVTPKLWQLPNWLNPSHKWVVYKKDNQLIFENYLKKQKIVYNLRKTDFVF